MDYLLYILYITFALLPSIIWLFFYLSKDIHPEPKKAIFKVFFLGIVVAAAVYLIALAILNGIARLFPNLEQANIWFAFFKYFIIVAFIEESAKYLIVRNFIKTSPDVDEPLDVMLYLVVSALGFAMLENILIIFTTAVPAGFLDILNFSAVRFIGATFLHTLASGTLGFFLALSLYHQNKRKRIFWAGLCLAVIMHGFYNLVLVELAGWPQALIQAIILLVLAVFTTWGFIKLKNTKSIGLEKL